MIDSNRFSAGVAVLSKHCIKTVQTVRSTISHDVPLSAQLAIAFETRKVLHMPGPALCFCTFVC